MASDVASTTSEMATHSVGVPSRRKASVVSISEKDIPEKFPALSERRQSIMSSTAPPDGHPNLLRRRSTFRSITQSILTLRRMTAPKIKPIDMTPKVKYENTYKMAPDKGKHFGFDKISQAVELLLKKEIGNKEYHEVICGKMALDLSNKVKDEVKEMEFPRYKIISQVLIGQIKDQGIEAASRCIWDPNTDNYACVSYKNETIFAVAMIYGVYLE